MFGDGDDRLYVVDCSRRVIELTARVAPPCGLACVGFFYFPTCLMAGHQRSSRADDFVLAVTTAALMGFTRASFPQVTWSQRHVSTRHRPRPPLPASSYRASVTATHPARHLAGADGAYSPRRCDDKAGRDAQRPRAGRTPGAANKLETISDRIRSRHAGMRLPCARKRPHKVRTFRHRL